LEAATGGVAEGKVGAEFGVEWQLEKPRFCVDFQGPGVGWKEWRDVRKLGKREVGEDGGAGIKSMRVIDNASSAIIFWSEEEVTKGTAL
jgi:hypothetical protein